MKMKSTYAPRLLAFCLLLTSLFFSLQKTEAQICTNPNLYIYGLTNAGMLHRVTTTTANVGAAMTPAYAGNAPSYANAMGYNSINGKFYYFKRNTNVTPQEFVSFDPGLNTVAMLASSPAGTTTIINLGCVNAAGTGYFGLDAFGKLYYYNIILNTWTLITSTLTDQFGTNLTATINARIYGDIAFDGLGNLWILCASATDYGLYEISGPLPTTPVASLTAKQLIAPTTATPNGNSIGGMAFNGTGQIFVSTNSPDNKLFRLENNLSFTFLGTFNIDGVGNDLTSCNFPFGVLPISWESFTAGLQNNHDVLLNWSISQQLNNKGYYVEHSFNGKEWESLGFIDNNELKTGTVKYSFLHKQLVNGKHYYRIRQVDFDGRPTYSETRSVDISLGNEIAMGPNPAKNVIRIQIGSSMVKPGRLKIFDLSGRIMVENSLVVGINIIDIASLPAGTYLARIVHANGEDYNQKIVKH